MRTKDSGIRTRRPAPHWRASSALRGTSPRGYSTVHDEGSTRSEKQTRRAANLDSCRSPCSPRGHAAWRVERLDTHIRSSGALALRLRARKQPLLKFIERLGWARSHPFDAIVGVRLQRVEAYPFLRA